MYNKGKYSRSYIWLLTLSSSYSSVLCTPTTVQSDIEAGTHLVPFKPQEPNCRKLALLCHPGELAHIYGPREQIQLQLI